MTKNLTTGNYLSTHDVGTEGNSPYWRVGDDREPDESKTGENLSKSSTDEVPTLTATPIDE